VRIPEIEVGGGGLRNGADNAAAKKVEGKDFVGTDGGEDEVMQTAEMRLRFYLATVGQGGVEKKFEIESARGAGKAGALPARDPGENLVGVGGQCAVSPSDEEISVEWQHAAVDEMKFCHGRVTTALTLARKQRVCAGRENK
jgi:hypothetical protein